MFVALVFVTLVVYRSDTSLGFFHLDDPGYIIENEAIKEVSAGNIWRILTEPYFANYSPTHLLSYMIDWSIGEGSARTFHISSNVWAGICAGWLYLVALLLLGHRLIAASVAVLFIVHPAHVEAVAWLSSRKDLVSVAFALPSVFCYLWYRETDARKWYLWSVGLFVVGVAGKLAVAVLPAILLSYEWLVQRRAFTSCLLNKVPFLALSVLFVIPTANSQADTGFSPDPFVIGATVLQNFWLLTGFGEHVIYRDRPATDSSLLTILVSIVPLLCVVLPLWFRRAGIGLSGFLVCWILFAFLPPMGLSFVHPVTDRYLFFPSVGLVLLIGVALKGSAEKWDPKGTRIALGCALVVAGIWAYRTLDYLGEWTDPRSVWHAAAKKSNDSFVFQYLGTHLMDNADQIATPASERAASSTERLGRLADVYLSADDAAKANRELRTLEKPGPASIKLRDLLRSEAQENLSKALERKGTRLSPNLYFRRGKLAFDRGDRVAAKREFLLAIDEAARHTFQEHKYELLARSHHALFVLGWHEQDYVEARRQLLSVREIQTRAGRQWITDVDHQMTRLASRIAQSQK